MRSICLSIIIPCYNAEFYIETCLKSIIEQNVQNIEILCLDDCSTDKTREIIKHYQEKEDRIKLFIHNKNFGPGYLRNEGLKYASGEWVIFCDSDDWFEIGLFESLKQIISNYQDIDIIEFLFNISKSDNQKKVATWLDRGTSGIRYTKDENIMLATGNGNKLYRKSFLKKYKLCNLVDNRSGEEIPMHICAFLLAKKFYYLNKIGYNWRINVKSLSRNKRKYSDFFNGVFKMLCFLKTELKRLHLYNKNDYIHYCKTVFGWHINEKRAFSFSYIFFYIRHLIFLFKIKLFEQGELYDKKL